nr:glycerol-3-phosphate acyltransferase [Angustibacter aerolatus]
MGRRRRAARRGEGRAARPRRVAAARPAARLRGRVRRGARARHLAVPARARRQGVATTLGVLLVLAPLWVLGVAVVFGVVLLVTRWMGGASSAGALTLLGVSLVVPPAPGSDAGLWSRLFGIALVLVVLGRHRSNLVLRWMARRARAS